MGLGENIRKRRIELQMTQSELAERMGYRSKVTICRVENGEDNVNSDRVERFAKALNTTPGVLMGWTGQSEPEVIEPSLADDISRLNESNRRVIEMMVRTMLKEQGDK